MTSEEDIVKNHISCNLTYMTWRDHLGEFVKGYWVKFFFYLFAGLGFLWGIVEAASFFYPNLNLKSLYIVLPALGVCIFGALCRCIIDYRNIIPQGLEDESLAVHNIYRSRKPFWEYALAYELLKDRVEEIDQELDDVVNNRVHVKVTQIMDAQEYIQWINKRQENLLRIVESAKQLLIFDLATSLQSNDGEHLDFVKLVKVVDLIKALYRTSYDFHVESLSIKFPDIFALLHEIQGEWILVVQDGIRQMLEILHSVATRKKDDFSPVEATITFQPPPRADEFCQELDRIADLL